MNRGDAALVVGGALVGIIASGWIYDAGYRDGEKHGRLTEHVKHEVEREVERQLRESARKMGRSGRR